MKFALRLKKDGRNTIYKTVAQLPKVRDALVKAVADLTKEKEENTRQITVLQESNKLIADLIEESNKTIKTLSELC